MTKLFALIIRAPVQFVNSIIRKKESLIILLVKLSSPMKKKIVNIPFFNLIFITCHALDNDYKMLVKYLPLIFLPCVLGFPKKVHIGERKKISYRVYKFCGTTSWTRKVFLKLLNFNRINIPGCQSCTFSLVTIVSSSRSANINRIEAVLQRGQARHVLTVISFRRFIRR